MSRIFWFLFAFLAVGVGFYPLMYLILDMNGGLLSSKPEALLASHWMWGFYLHILAGGVALLVGWTQFISKLRKKNRTLHRWLGKVYLFAVTISGFAGFYIALEATGGIIATLGFGTLALAWLFTSFQAWISILKGSITRHQEWMVRSYSLCFAAVTLRIWLPSFLVAGFAFEQAYVIISWLCWVPNLLFAEWFVRKQLRGNRSSIELA